MHRPHGHEGSGVIGETDDEGVAVTTSAAMSDASISQHGAYELVVGDVLGATEKDRPADPLARSSSTMLADDFACSLPS